MFNSRRTDSPSNTHREIINQFMVEWDGLTSDNKGVLLMAATNRPFDLDDAVLRRMPRRMLGMYLYNHRRSIQCRTKCLYTDL